MFITTPQVAAQMYTVRDYLKTPADIKDSLKKIKRIGYQAVQLSGLGPIETSELKKMLDDLGLVACSTHESGDEILNEPQKVADKLLELGATSTGYPFPAGVDFSSVANVKALAKNLNKAGKVLKQNKLTLVYHNHNIEFLRYKDKTALEIIYENTDPEFLQGEIDTYWVQVGGGDPVAWCKSLKKRLPVLHLKDCGVSADRKTVFKEIGQGNLNWPAIVKAAKSSGCKWYVVEQDSNWAGDDPFKSLRMSFKYIKENLCIQEDK
jgi:sugar phosphate isomerase/epimerase